MSTTRAANKGMTRVMIECLDTMGGSGTPASVAVEARSELIGMCKILYALDYGWTYVQVYEALVVAFARFEQDNGKRPARGSGLLRQWDNDCGAALLAALGRLD